MKKTGIGCLVVLGVVVCIITVGAILAMQRAREFVGGITQVAQVGELNEQIRNRSSYQPPVDQALAATQVASYVDIQRVMVDRLGNRMRELEAKYEQLSARHEEQGRDANVREVLGAWRDMVGLIVDAKRAQVDALNAAGLSLEEYNWIRAQILFAMGHGFSAVDYSQIDADRPVPALPDAPSVSVQEQNLAVLEPYLDDAEAWIPLSFFGL